MAAVKKQPAKQAAGKSMAKWDEELARRAQVSAGIEANVGGEGNNISTRGGILAYKGVDIVGNKLNCIILNHVIENAFYENDFDPDNPQPPDCYAFGTDEDDMKPHEKASDIQHNDCSTCPHNEWGSAEKGNGKACKNIRRLAIIPQDALEDVDAAEVAMLKIPVMSVKGWAGYVKNLKDTFKRPTCSVITEVSAVKDAKAGFKLQFKLVEKIDGDALGELFEKADSVVKMLTAPYQKVEREDPPAKGKGRSSKPNKAAASRAVARGTRR